jgi:spermidine/putrescine-binding protein
MQNLLSGRWKRLVTRNEQGDAAGHGKVFGVPYRWGCTVIVYRKDRLRRRDKEGEGIRDWDDLLRPSLRRRIAFMDYPREFVGIALKTLGMSYNSSKTDLDACGIGYENVERRLRHLLSQAKVVSNKDHVRAYSAGDVDVIVGSSDDLIPLAQKSSNSVIVIPASGTALFADLWCIPKNAAGGYVFYLIVEIAICYDNAYHVCRAVNGEPSPLVPAWLELCLQPVRANAASGLQKGASPQLLPGKRAAAKTCNPLPSSDTDAYIIDSRELPPQHILEKSEFLEPLDAESIAMYRKALGLH